MFAGCGSTSSRGDPNAPSAPGVVATLRAAEAALRADNFQYFCDHFLSADARNAIVYVSHGKSCADFVAVPHHRGAATFLGSLTPSSRIVVIGTEATVENSSEQLRLEYEPGHWTIGLAMEATG